MGLDLYVQWQYMKKTEKEAQITGFADAPEVGYLRYNWAGVSFVGSFSAEHGLTCPIPCYVKWSGYNSDELKITPESLADLRAEKDAMIAQLQVFDFDKYGEDGEYMRMKMKNAVKLIEFIEANTDKKHLKLLYG